MVLKIMSEKNSNLCIGLDLKGDEDGKLLTANQIIEETSEYAAAYKPNRQFWLGSNLREMQELTSKIQDAGAISIIDHKLSDVGSSNKSAIEWVANEGFDLMTVSPFPGNIGETSMIAKLNNVGLINLVLMSNPEARWMASKKYVDFADESEKFCSGMVLGTTNHVDKEILAKVAQIAPSPFVLAPGLGHQGGSVHLMAEIFGPRVLFSVSRGISEAENYQSAAEKYHHEIHRYLKM